MRRSNAEVSALRALVYRGIGIKALVDRPKPEILESGDAVLRMLRTTISEIDLNVLNGDIASCMPGRILGHEGIGLIETVGSGVKDFRPGQRVLISRISSCGNCRACRRGMPAHCLSGGWLLGNEIDGTQAEYVRIPHADGSLHALRSGDNEAGIVLLSDLLPSAYECGLLNGELAACSTLVIIGCGPLGLAALMMARAAAPLALIMVDSDPFRRHMADRLGATRSIAPDDRYLLEICRHGLSDDGADIVIEATGTGIGFLLAQELVAAGGTIAITGAHPAKAYLHLEQLWSRNIRIVTGLPNALSTGTLLGAVQSARLDPSLLITHRFDFNMILHAYELMATARESCALKILLDVT